MDLSSKDTSQQLLQASSMSDVAKAKIYKKLTEDLKDFINNAGKDWAPEEECRRFTIFGDCIVCARWEGKLLVSGSDVVKCMGALYRLANLGKLPRDQRKFKESITGDLRNLKTGSAALLEDANSPLLRFLFRISSVRTHKRQKVFFWTAVPFMDLFLDAMSRERRNSIPSPPDLKVVLDSHQLAVGAPHDYPRFLPRAETHYISGPESAYRSPSFSGSESQASYALYIPKALQSLPEFRQGHEEITKLAIIADAALDIETTTAAAAAKTKLMPIGEASQNANPLESLPSITTLLGQEL